MKNGFIMIPDSLFKEKMPDKARILLGIITRYSKKDGYAFASNEIYANKLKCTTRTITKLIKYLVDNNYITITNPKTDKRKIYVEGIPKGYVDKNGFRQNYQRILEQSKN